VLSFRLSPTIWSDGKLELHALADAVTSGGRHSRHAAAFAVHQPSISTIAKARRKALPQF
jgi:hypothetical protein